MDMKVVKDKSYVISVSIKTGCYRHIRIDGDELLSDLHLAIIEAVGFDDDHLHAFFMDNKKWSQEQSFYSENDEWEGNYTNQVKLNELELTKGKQFKYIFDFGEEWCFQCKVLQVLDEKTDETILIKSVGEAPFQYGCEDEFDYDLDDELEDEECYTAEQADKLYGELNFSQDVLEMLKKYFDAFSNLYGKIILKKALRIIEKQNGEISHDEFYKFAEIIGLDERTYFYVIDEAEIYSDVKPNTKENFVLVHEAYLIDNDEYRELDELQFGKSYYVPEKIELLKYADEWYFEETEQYKNLNNFFEKKMKLKRAEEISEEIVMLCSLDSDLEDILNCLQMMKVNFKDSDNFNEFLGLFQDLSNNTRRHVNCGFTPKEIYFQSSHNKPKQLVLGKNILNSLENGELNPDEWIETFESSDLPLSFINGALNQVKEIKNKTEKIGRNEPCPCGSGKKYKKCCGR